MCMSRNRIILVTAGIMLSLFLASMESTVVATAMPVIMSPVDEASELWLSQSRRDVCNPAKLNRQARKVL